MLPSVSSQDIVGVCRRNSQASAAQVAAAFVAAPPDRVAELLETLVTLGRRGKRRTGGTSQGSSATQTRQRGTISG
jgi:hypothetical protein